MDPTGNSMGATGQIPLEVTNNVPGANGFSQAKTVDFNMTVKMPADMKCTGGEFAPSILHGPESIKVD